MEENANAGYQGSFTADQMANLKKFGKKIPENKVVQRQVINKTQSKPVSAPPKKTTQVQEKAEVEAAVSTEPVVSQTEQIETKPSFNGSSETYFHLGTEESSYEIDLVTFREKGEETRYISMLLSGYVEGAEGNQPIRQEAFFNITTREDFEELKRFFAQLNWED